MGSRTARSCCRPVPGGEPISTRRCCAHIRPRCDTSWSPASSNSAKVGASASRHDEMIQQRPGFCEVVTRALARLPRLILAAALLAPTAAVADAAADFYHGKTINLYVSFPPGGGYDIYARILAPYFTRHIPGNPAVVIKNMEGGSGVKAAGYITSVTPQDGTSLGMFLDVLTLGKVLGG